MQFLPKATPESQGIRSGDILKFIERLSQNEPYQDPHAFLLVRHGKLLAEGYFAPFGPDEHHSLFSVSKSVISTAIGFCVQEGRLSLDDLIRDYFPEYLPENPAPEFEQLRLRHVLSMTVGQDGVGVHMTLRGVSSGIPEAFFRTPFLDAPGTTFRYSSAATHMLGKLVERVTGQNAIEYLTPRLFDPLGIEPPFSRKSPEGSLLGFTGMRMTAREMVKYGQFYLNRGSWNGKQLLNPEWIAEASKKQIDCKSVTGSEWSQGYCWQFWRGTHNTFRFCGAHGQMCIMSPDRDLICFVNSGYDNSVLQYVIDSFYSTIWDGMQDEPYAEAPAENAKLQNVLANLSLPHVYSTPSPLATLLNGVTYHADDGEIADVRFTFTDDVCTMEMTGRDGVSRRLRAGMKAPVSEISDLADLYSVEPADMDNTEAFAYWLPLRKLNIVARVVPTPTDLVFEAEFESTDTLKLHMQGYRAGTAAVDFCGKRV